MSFERRVRVSGGNSFRRFRSTVVVTESMLNLSAAGGKKQRNAAAHFFSLAPGNWGVFLLALNRSARHRNHRGLLRCRRCRLRPTGGSRDRSFETCAVASHARACSSSRRLSFYHRMMHFFRGADDTRMTSVFFLASRDKRALSLWWLVSFFSL